MIPSTPSALSLKLVACSSKLAALSSPPGRYLEEIDQVITDSGIPEHYKKTLESLGIEVTII